MRFFQKTMLLFSLLIFLAANSCAEALDTSKAAVFHAEFTYGQSELGRPLICHRVGNDNAERVLLIVFGVHGFEDAFAHDGEILKAIAENVISHFVFNAEELQDFCLYCIPCANPDGLIEGTTTDGFGRCNANGLDINRDFSFDWKSNTESRNKTGKAPFSTAEARAIRDLVEKIKPSYGIDVHGWKGASYGNGVMAEVFAKPFDFKIKRLSTEGMLGAWMKSMMEDAILLELPFPPDKETYVAENSANLIEGISAWINRCQAGK